MSQIARRATRRTWLCPPRFRTPRRPWGTCVGDWMVGLTHSQREGSYLQILRNGYTRSSTVHADDDADAAFHTSLKQGGTPRLAYSLLLFVTRDGFKIVSFTSIRTLRWSHARNKHMATLTPKVVFSVSQTVRALLLVVECSQPLTPCTRAIRAHARKARSSPRASSTPSYRPHLSPCYPCLSQAQSRRPFGQTLLRAKTSRAT